LHSHGNKPSANGKINFLSLNVCGLYSKLQLGVFENYIQSFDIVCLSETRTSFIDKDDINGFTPYFQFKNQIIHGVCILVKSTIARYVIPFHETQSEHVLWLYIEKGCIGKGIIVGAIYLPHENSPHYNTEMFDKIEEDILYFKVKFPDISIVMLGDFNARTGTLDDFLSLDKNMLKDSGLILDEDFIYYDKDKLKSQGIFTERINKDRNINKNGRCLIDTCRNLNLKIVNGRFGEDQNVGAFTCESHNGSSVVDYAIVSANLLMHISNFEIDVMDYCLSDVHRPVCLGINYGDGLKHFSLQTNVDSDTNNIDNGAVVLKHVWDTNLASRFKNEIDLEEVSKLHQVIDNTNFKEIDQALINDIAKNICQLFIDTGKKVGISKEIMFKKQTRNISKFEKSKRKPWFNNDCKKKRAEYFKLKRLVKKNPRKYAEFKQASKVYKKLIKTTSRNYFKNIHSTLRHLKCSDSREYWKILNNANKKNDKSNSISLHTFFEHFQKPNTNERVTLENENVLSSLSNFTNEFIDKDFTLSEMKAVIKKLKNGKACGVDSIINEFLKNCSDEFLSVILKIFQYCVRVRYCT
jgi:hypothetical protein